MSVEDYKRQAEEWLVGFLKDHDLDWDKMTPGEHTRALMQIPCAIRCWRVGGPTGAKPGGRCDECGRLQTKRTSWERLPLPV